MNQDTNNPSKVIKCGEYEWESIPRKEYKDQEAEGCYRGVHRYTLLGEGEGEEALNFQTRYFEVEPGGYTSFEHHRHPHSVVVIRGSGEVILENELHRIGLHDVVFVAPDTPHQFHASKEEPLGFICIVDRYRDRPTLPDEAYIEQHIDSREIRGRVKR
ncbi:MAG: cupin domain-containing protein [Balneolaceae bacterium]|nr:cupin domain-containing protein [Balneolaceae bacterium]